MTDTQDSVDFALRKRPITCRDRAQNLPVQLDLVESDTVVDVRLAVLVRHGAHLASWLAPQNRLQPRLRTWQAERMTRLGHPLTMPTMTRTCRTLP